MIEFPLAALGGLVGSAHCIGMCGPIVVSLGVRGRSARSAFAKQIIYASGRVTTYALAGVIAGFCGLWLGAKLESFSIVRPYVTLVGGLALLLIGLGNTGLVTLRSQSISDNCLGPQLFARLHDATSQTSTFVAGAINGLLPCGLVYAYLSLAFTSNSLLTGGALMACFGVGTIPALATLGMGAARLNCRARMLLFRAGGWAMSAMAIWLIGSAIRSIGWEVTVEEMCPFC